MVLTHEHGVAGIDPHKNSATIAVLDQRGGVVGSESFPITEEGIDELLTFLLGIELAIDRIGVEGSGFLGRPIVLALTAAGYDVREVQANRTAERRKRRRRAKTDIEDAEAIARETLADPHLPPAGKHTTPSPAWQTLTVLRDWRASLVLQRVRLLTEAEAVLVTLPVAIRDALPSTSRVLPQLVALADGQVVPAALAPADRLKLDRLATSLLDITTLTKRIKETRPADPRDTHRARIHAHRPARYRCRDGDGPARRDRRPAQVHQRSTIRTLVWNSAGRGLLRRRARPSPTTSTRPGREPRGQLDPAHHPRHSGSLSPAGQGVRGTKDSREQE
jgi:transposase